MNLRALLTFSVAVFFGTQLPLCVFACIEQAGKPVAAHHSSETPPCHADSSGPSESPRSSGYECRCDQLNLFPAKGDSAQSVSAVKTLSTPVVPLLTKRTGFPRRAALAGDHYRSLPPPDILLLNSTLIL